MADVRDVLHEPAWVRRTLIALAVLAMLALVVLPLAMVLAAAFAKGPGVWLAALREPDALSALNLTLFTAAIVIPVNAVFGLFAAWALARFEFRGKQLLLSLIDLPFAVSPVVAGLCLVLLFGSQGWFAELLAGAFFVEYIFGWQGIGKVTVDALEKLDYPVVMGSVLISAAFFVLINILADILYGVVDPRIRMK
jgi:sulfate transport system permease protein